MERQLMMSRCALILPGAVSKGAYEAGVIQVIAEKHIPVHRIVATSSGALNGIAFAAGIRSGQEKQMARQLTEMWIDDGGWGTALSFSPWTFMRGRGISDRQGLLTMLKKMIKPVGDLGKADIDFRVIVSPLKGVVGKIGNSPASTYEQVINFTGEDFDTPERLEQVFEVTMAACAFPGLFAPVEIKGLGPCVDGGAVNNAPIGYALQENDITDILMPVPFPELIPPTTTKHGLGFLNHLIEILINERLFRELKNANSVNEDVNALTSLVSKGIITSKQLEIIKQTLRIRHVQITEIRPEQTLCGNPFSGFFSKSARTKMVDEGRSAALKILADSESKSKVEKS
jgi:predicted acylesterase/phospholipase RssA